MIPNNRTKGGGWMWGWGGGGSVLVRKVEVGLKKIYMRRTMYNKNAWTKNFSFFSGG